SVVPRPVEFDNGPQGRGTPLPVGDIRPQDERGRTRDDVVDLTDQVVFGNRVRRGLVQLSAIDHADADVSFPELNIPYLLIDQLLGDGFFRVALKLRERNVCPRTHIAGRLRVGG